MIKNYFIITFRRLKKDRVFAFLNIAGLTIGVASFILLALYVQHELSMDQYHKNGDRIFTLAQNVKTSDGMKKWGNYRASYAVRMRNRIPELSRMAILSNLGGEVLIKTNENSFYENGVFLANNEFLETFDFLLLEGEAKLNEPDKGIITQSMSKKYFGDLSPIGEILEVDEHGSFEITAIIADPPANSSIQFDALLSSYEVIKTAEARFANRGGNVVAAYVLLPENFDLTILDEKVSELMLNEWPENAITKDENGKLVQNTYFFPFEDVYLKSSFSWGPFQVSDVRYVYLFASIAVLILVIACLNYVNLITARSIQKLKEIGLRKVFGAEGRQIFRQYIFESFLYTFLSVVLAFAIAERLLPYYNNMIEKELTLSYFSLEFLVFVFGLSLLVGLASGIYPAVRLSSFKPVSALYGTGKTKEKSGIRRAMVFFQFLVAQGLIVATVIIQSQLNYLQNKDLGYDRENVLFVNTYNELGDQTRVFKEEVAKIPGVKYVSLSDNIIDNNSISFSSFKELDSGMGAQEDEHLVMSSFETDPNFFRTLGMKVASGLSLDEIASIDSNDKIVITRGMENELNWGDLVGRKLNIWDKPREVVAVIDDFHNESLKSDIMPSLFVLSSTGKGFLSVRFNPGKTREALTAIEDVWYKMVDDRPFMFQFYDDYYDANYRKETQLGNVFNVFSAIAISISILGLIGLSAFTAEQRLKEFGIRKVLGASINQLLMLMSREFIWLITLSFLVACPIAYMSSNSWLDTFKYKTQITPFTFLIGLLVTMGIAALSVIYQSIKVARENPTEILRNE